MTTIVTITVRLPEFDAFDAPMVLQSIARGDICYTLRQQERQASMLTYEACLQFAESIGGTCETRRG